MDDRGSLSPSLIISSGRMPSARARILAGFLAFSFSVAPLLLRADSFSDHLTPAESRGKIIYTTGRSPSGRQLSYRFVSGGDLLPARGVACMNCHGVDGRGGKEGDVIAPAVTREALTKPSTASGLSGRLRAPYTDALLARAITDGVDSSGEPLNPFMPRWSLSKSELEDLLRYLNRLGSEQTK
jgi:cytochrome c